MILCPGMLATSPRNVAPNAHNKPHRSRYALSMTALKRVIAAARLTKIDERSRPVTTDRPMHFRSALRIPYARAYVPAAFDPRCIDVGRSNKISLVYMFARLHHRDIFRSFPGIRSPRYDAKASPEVDRFLLIAS